MKRLSLLRGWLSHMVARAPSGGGALAPEMYGGSDKWLLGATLILSVLGLVLIYSATAATSSQATFYLQNQSLKVLVGIVAFAAGWRIDYHRWVRWAPALYLLGLVALILVFVPGLGDDGGGASRWIKVGGVSLQPVDFTRLALVVYLAFLLSKPRERLARFSTGLLPCVVALGLVVVPVAMQPNLSTTLALTMITGLMVLAGRIPWRHVALLASPVVLAVPFLGRAYQFERIRSWIDYWLHGAELQGANYQMHQSIIAIGSGGLFGRGLGESRQKWDFLPDRHTDFIFAILGEELGFAGALFVITLLAVILWRAYEAARRAPDRAGALLAVGIGATVAVYAGVNMSVATGLFPTTGLPLPLISYGGSAVLVMLFSLGILGNIASQGRSKPLAGSGDQD